MRVNRGSSLIPLFLDLEGKSAVVYGAGPVGVRKASYLAREARVTMVDRHAAVVPEGVHLIIGEAMHNLDLIESADIVVAATGDPKVDDEITRKAAGLGKMLNRADRPGNFLIPSLIRRRNFTVAISTMGRSPVMSQHIKGVIDSSLPSVLEDMVDLTERLREQLKRSVPEAAEREGRVRRILEDPDIWKVLETDPGKAYELAVMKVMG